MKNHVKLFIVALAAALWPALAPAQNLFVACYNGSSGSTIYKFTTNGVGSAFVTVSNYVYGLAVDGAGNLFVADNNVFVSGGNFPTNYIYKFTPDGTMSVFASSWYLYFSSLALDSRGNLFALGYNGGGPGNSWIQEFTTNGTSSYFCSFLFYGNGLAVDTAGDVFSSDATSNGVVYKFTPDGTRSALAITGAGVYGSMACDGAGNLFASQGGTIYKFASNGSCSTFASSYGYGLVFDNAGNLLASDANSGNIYQYAPDGTQSTFASGLSSPGCLAFQSTPSPPAPVPALNIAPTGNQTALFWPAWATNYILESTTDLSSTNWTAVTNGVPIIGVTLTNTSPAQFFRLRQF